MWFFPIYVNETYVHKILPTYQNKINTRVYFIDELINDLIKKIKNYRVTIFLLKIQQVWFF